MKLQAPSPFSPQPVLLVGGNKAQRPNTGTAPGNFRGGTAVIVMLALLAIVMVYILVNLRLLTRLDRELMLTERHQVRRLDALNATNQVITVSAISITNAPATNAPVRVEGAE